MKRILALPVLAASFAVTGIILIPSASSAMPRDVCLDEQHYLEQHEWYMQNEMHYADISLAWTTAVRQSNPVSGLSWTAHLPSGDQTVFTLADYTARDNSAYNDWVRAANATATFEATYTPC